MKDIFCANCQIVTPHQGVVDANGEFVFTCTNTVASTDGNPPGQICGRFIKFPADITKEEFATKVDEHQAQNVGQVSVEAQEEKLAELISQPPTEQAPVEPPTDVEMPADGQVNP